MNNMSPKSATTAGLLGIFLGAFGAHEWYLGNKKKATIHLGVTGAGVLMNVLAVILPFAMAGDGLTALGMLTFVTPILLSLGGLIMFGASVWGLVDGIRILAGGDQALAMKGYPVAGPVMMPPMQPQMPNNGFQPQPMMQNQQMGQPMVQPQPPMQPQMPVQPQTMQPQPSIQSQQPFVQDFGANQVDVSEQSVTQPENGQNI